MFGTSKYLLHKTQCQNNLKHSLLFHETTSHIVKSNKRRKNTKYTHLTLSLRRFRFNLYRSRRRLARKNSNFRRSFVAHSDVISRIISLNDISKECKFIEE